MTQARPVSVSNKLGASTSSARLKQLAIYAAFQYPARKSWKPQRDHTAARLPREVPREATRRLLIQNGRPWNRGSPIFCFSSLDLCSFQFSDKFLFCVTE